LICEADWLILSSVCGGDVAKDVARIFGEVGSVLAEYVVNISAWVIENIIVGGVILGCIKNGIDVGRFVCG